MATESLAPVTKVDDSCLARQVAAGDRSAFEQLMRRYNRRLYRLARDAFAAMSAYRSIGKFRGEATLSTWLSRLVLNACGERRRRSQRRENIVPILSTERAMDSAARVPDGGEQPEQLVARTQMRSVLERKVGELPEIFRVVFMLRSVEELSVDEIADILAIAPETVRSRHFRAKGMLRESLAKEIDLAEADIYEFAGARCDSIVANVLARLNQT